MYLKSTGTVNRYKQVPVEYQECTRKVLKKNKESTEKVGKSPDVEATFGVGPLGHKVPP